MSQTLFINATLACIDTDSGYGLRDNAALLVDGDRIAWRGPMSECPPADGAEVYDCKQRLLTPGLIDCHTHLVYGGDRADEFEQRLEGVSYADIAARGGGIVSTVNATRAASADELFDQANKAKNNQEQEIFFESMRNLRIQRKNVETEFVIDHIAHEMCDHSIIHRQRLSLRSVPSVQKVH